MFFVTFKRDNVLLHSFIFELTLNVHIEHAKFFGDFSAFLLLLSLLSNWVNNHWHQSGSCTAHCSLSTESSGWGLTSQSWGLTRHYRGSGCSGRVWPLDVITARPWGSAEGTAGTLLAPLLLSGTSCRTPVSPTGCWCRLPSFSSREQSDVPGRLKISTVPSKHWAFSA